MHTQPHRRSKHRHRFEPTFAGTVECAEPAEVALEVRRGNALELGEPGFESAVIRIGVLDVPGAAYALANSQVHSFVLHAQLARRTNHRGRAVRAQDGVAVDAGLERLA